MCYVVDKLLRSFKGRENHHNKSRVLHLWVAQIYIDYYRVQSARMVRAPYSRMTVLSTSASKSAGFLKKTRIINILAPARDEADRI